MMKTKKIFLLLALLLMSLGIQAQNAEFETAAEAVKNMKVGWNLGLTLDSHLDVESPYCRFESFWVNPTIMPKFFEMLHKAGINAVRLPVTWFPHMDSSGRVDAKWMKRVHEVVDYIIDEGMYCILNTCRDASNDYSWLWADDSYYEVQERYCGLWSQIATEFKDYDEHLQFSAWNEILERQEIFGGDSYKDRYKVLNQINQDFVNAVRSTGGNNIYRNLIVGPYYNWSVYNGDEIPQHFVDSFQALAVPSDIKPGHISFEVHAYYNTNEPDHNKRLDTTIREMKTYLMSKNVPVIFSEWGPSGDWRISSSKTYEFAKRTMEQTKANNIAVFPLTGPLSEGVFRTLPAFESKEFLEAILKGYYGEDYEAPIPTINDFNVGITYTEEGQNFTLVDDPAIDTSKFKGFLLELQQVEEGQLELFLVSNWEENWEDNKIVIIPITSTSTYIPFPDERLGKEIKSIFLRHAKEGRYQANIKKSVLLGKDDEEFCRIDVWDEKFSSSPKESYYSYTVNEVVDGNIVRTITGEGTPDSEITVPYHRYNLLNGKLYLKDASGGPKGLEYNHYFTLTENNQVETINYEQTDIQDVVFFAEGEDIPGMTLCDNDNMRVRSSNSLAAYVANGSVGFVTLPAGSYRLTAFIHNSYKDPDSYWKFLAGDKEIANLHCTVVNIQELQSEVFTLNEKTTLYIPQCGDERSGIDLLYITKEKDAEPVTITADDKTMTYGDKVPTLTYTISGAALNGTPSLSTTATKASPVGTYTIKVEQGTVTNENVIYVDGTLTIEKADLTVGVEDVTITEGDAIPSFILTYSGFRNGDTESKAFTTKPKATTTATAYSKAGTYPITVSGGKATNYALNYTQGTLTIEPASGIEGVYADGQGNAVIFNINGQKLSKPKKGINIIGGKKVVVK